MRMMDDKRQFDFWYAVNNTEVLITPEKRLETFGSSVVNYTLVTELMDDVTKVRVREGRVQAYRPEIITPDHLSGAILDNFGDEAERYMEWLRAQDEELVLLQYGFSIKKEEVREQLITDRIDAVVERIREDVVSRNDPLTALLVGVDDPWEVCLVKLMVEVVQQSVAGNVNEYRQHRRLMRGTQTALEIQQEVEEEFQIAAINPGRIKQLGEMLQKRGLFKEYEDRFYALVRSQRRY